MSVPKGSAEVAGMDLPSDYEPAEYDVLCGNRREYFFHKGNIHFRKVIGTFVPRYIAAQTRIDKRRVVSELVDFIVAQCRAKGAVGFIVRLADWTGQQQAGQESQWRKLANGEAKEKCGHAIRKSAKLFEIQNSEEAQRLKNATPSDQHPSDGTRHKDEASKKSDLQSGLVSSAVKLTLSSLDPSLPKRKRGPVSSNNDNESRSSKKIKSRESDSSGSPFTKPLSHSNAMTTTVTRHQERVETIAPNAKAFSSGLISERIDQKIATAKEVNACRTGRLDRVGIPSFQRIDETRDSDRAVQPTKDGRNMSEANPIYGIPSVGKPSQVNRSNQEVGTGHSKLPFIQLIPHHEQGPRSIAFPSVGIQSYDHPLPLPNKSALFRDLSSITALHSLPPEDQQSLASAIVNRRRAEIEQARQKVEQLESLLLNELRQNPFPPSSSSWKNNAIDGGGTPP